MPWKGGVVCVKVTPAGTGSVAGVVALADGGVVEVVGAVVAAVNVEAAECPRVLVRLANWIVELTGVL